MDTRVQIDAILSSVMTLTEEGVNVTQINVDYEAGTIFLTVGA